MTTGDTHDDDHDQPGRRGLTSEQRLELVERDVRSHARSLTMLTKSVGAVGEGFSERQLKQLHDAFAEALADVGLRVDDADHVDDAREDFRFLRRFRTAWDGAAKGVGQGVLLAIVGVALTIIGFGFWAWLGKGLGK